MLLAGAMVDGVGFVPLGASGKNASGAGTIGDVTMRATPIYGGLEVGQYAVMAVGYPFLAGQGVFNLPTDIAMVWQTADALDDEIRFETPFLPMPVGSSYDISDREISFGAHLGADVVRVVLRGPTGRWVVWVPPGKQDVTMPRPPEGFADHTGETRVTFSSVKLRDGLGAEDLFEISSPGLADINTAMVGFSRVDGDARR